MISRRLIPALVAATMAFTACGGGSDGDAERPAETDSPEDDEPVEAVATTEPVVVIETTTPPSTTTTTTVAPTTVPPTTAAPAVDEASFTAFCDASTSFYLAAGAAFLEVTPEEPAFRDLFVAGASLLVRAIDAAPSEEAATVPRELSVEYVVLAEAFTSIDFDFARFQELPNSTDVASSIGAVAGITSGRLETFLVDECGRPIDELRSRRSDAATTARELAGGDQTPPDASAMPLEVADDSGQITATVPGTWSQVDGAPDGDIRQLVAAPDTAAFLASFTEPGLIIVSGDAPNGAGAAGAEAGLGGIVEAAVAQGCTENASTAYDDGVYTGTEKTFTCPGGPADVTFIGGTNGEASLFFLLALVADDGGMARTLVVDSFLVD